MENNDVVIIGAGPAGMATAIQLKRYNIEPIILEKDKIGGLLKNANLVENYPGFPLGISGVELVELFKKQMENAGIKVHWEEVLEIDYRDKNFFIRTNKKSITSQIVVISSGTKPKKLSDIEISEEIEGKIFYEIFPLFQIANQKIAIIGAGDCAFDYALNLSKKNEVVILNRGEKEKCLPWLLKRVMNSTKISYHKNTQVKKIKAHNSGLILVCSNLNGEFEIYVKYLVVAIGREPYLDFLSENIKRNLEYLQNAKQLFIIGDVKNRIYRQVAISVGDGIKTAMEIFRKLNGEKV